ncbi:MAG TPA: hypothetical protein VIM12_13265 [Noviherbaspirillum sp.]|jgi:hypothetical protein|uniref:hypothetical protein n=1 Tax=Noviherbaspirillum sp. TaxID=1926288 RepID=UPI002F9556EF
MSRNRIACLVAVAAALATVAASPALAAEEAVLKARLFSTPAERTAIDRLRDQHRAGATASSPDQAPPPVTAETTVDGVVRSSSGRSTVWVNQVPYLETPGKRGRAPEVPMPLPDGGSVRLRPGQTYDPEERRVRDAYQSPSDGNGQGQ